MVGSSYLIACEHLNFIALDLNNKICGPMVDGLVNVTIGQAFIGGFYLLVLIAGCMGINRFNSENHSDNKIGTEMAVVPNPTLKADPGSAKVHPEGSSSSLEADTLEIHNKCRAKHGAAPLTWNKECAQSAQKQADQCQAQNKLHHDNTEGPSGSHGQNAHRAGGQANVTRAVQGFYDEIKDYEFSSPGFNMNTGHFTQVVWKGTTSVGCGISSDGHYLVCNYYPAGNMTGAFPDNVAPVV